MHRAREGRDRNRPGMRQFRRVTPLRSRARASRARNPPRGSGGARTQPIPIGQSLPRASRRRSARMEHRQPLFECAEHRGTSGGVEARRQRRDDFRFGELLQDAHQLRYGFQKACVRGSAPHLQAKQRRGRRILPDEKHRRVSAMPERHLDDQVPDGRRRERLFEQADRTESSRPASQCVSAAGHAVRTATAPGSTPVPRRPHQPGRARSPRSRAAGLRQTAAGACAPPPSWPLP